MRTAVLFLVFNRPDTTQQVFEAIRAARPARLYVAADGPRPGRAGEAHLCAEVRRIATNVDWACEVETLLQDENLGCRRGPVRGIDWFFDQEDEGIILEDDVLPLPSFFRYCEELLERYRGDERVGAVVGGNLVSKYLVPSDSYFFSRYLHSSGWATWRRAWEHYDIDMNEWPAWRDAGGLRALSQGNRLFESYWRRMFDQTHRGVIDCWDYQWLFACWRHEMLGALPAQNLTRHMGYGPDATHATGKMPAHVRESIPRSLAFPLRHPTSVAPDPTADALIDARVFGLTARGDARRRLRRVKVRLRRTPLLGDLSKRAQRVLRAGLSGR